MSKKQTIENKKLVGKEFKNKFGSTIITTEYRANNDIEEYIKQVADLYINMIPDNLYQAMYDWTVDMND